MALTFEVASDTTQVYCHTKACVPRLPMHSCFSFSDTADPKMNIVLFQVDHTVIMYLINPAGEFTDYYGQYKTAQEISSGISVHLAKWKWVKE